MSFIISDYEKANKDCRHEDASSSNEIRLRLQLVLQGESNRSIALKTGCNAETVRRYRSTGRATALFIAAVAVNYEVNADWLLTGRGTRQVMAPDSESIANVLRTIASTIESDTP